MREHHKNAIAKLTKELENDQRFLALIIGGSIAKKRERPTSDIDVIIIATDEEFEVRKKNNDFHYSRTDLCDYEGGYIDGSVVDMSYMKTLCQIGNEPSRAAFNGSFIAFSKIPELDKLLNEIHTYQVSEKKEKIESFYAHLEAFRWFIQEAEKRKDKYLLMWATTEMVLHGGRMILAYNEVLYPYHKWLIHEIKNVANKPGNLSELIDTLLEDPSSHNAELFYKAIIEFREWEVPAEGWVSRFRKESEWHWMSGYAPLKDR